MGAFKEKTRSKWIFKSFFFYFAHLKASRVLSVQMVMINSSQRNYLMHGTSSEVVRVIQKVIVSNYADTCYCIGKYMEWSRAFYSVMVHV